MQLVLITPPAISATEPQLCNSLFAAGLQVLHGECTYVWRQLE
jgi:hypothetical protein